LALILILILLLIEENADVLRRFGYLHGAQEGYSAVAETDVVLYRVNLTDIEVYYMLISTSVVVCVC